VKIFQQVLGGRSTFFETPCIVQTQIEQSSTEHRAHLLWYKQACYMLKIQNMSGIGNFHASISIQLLHNTRSYDINLRYGQKLTYVCWLSLLHGTKQKIK